MTATPGPVAGVDLHHEITGEGRPLVLLHGGVGASEAFGALLPPLAAHRRVVAVHLEGHGLTPDGDRPLRFETMADDVAALIARLTSERADVMGYSVGGGVAWQLAFQHPYAVRRLIVASQPVTRAGWYPDVAAAQASLGPEAASGMSQSPLAQLYPGKDWGRLFGRLGELLGRDFDWSDDVRALSIPVLAVFADADAVRPEHIVELFHLLGGGKHDAGLDGSARPASRLAILPGATHYDVLFQPALAGIVESFLDAALPAAESDRAGA